MTEPRTYINRRRTRSIYGYVLVEVVVSMMVLTIGVLSVSRSFSVAMLARGLAQDYTDSRYLAGLRLWRAVALAAEGKLSLGHSQGRFGGEWPRFSWSQQVEQTSLPYYRPSIANENSENRPDQEERGQQAFFSRVVITVKWERRGEEFEKSVATLVRPIADMQEEQSALEQLKERDTS